MNSEAQNFRKNYKLNNNILADDNRNSKKDSYKIAKFENKDRDGYNILKYKEVYKAPKGTASKAKNKRKNQKLNLRLASLILAAGIGLGGISIVGQLNKEPEPTITQMQEAGMNSEKLGLEQDTLDLINKYDAYFTANNLDINNLTDNEIIEMIDDIKLLNFNVIKDKMANLNGVEREDIKLYYDFDKPDGGYNAEVEVDKGELEGKETYNNFYGLLGLGSQDSIPKEVAELILKTGNYESIVTDLKADHITKSNAIKELKKLYQQISSVATKEFTMDEKGNVKLSEYEETKEVQQENKEER